MIPNTQYFTQAQVDILNRLDHVDQSLGTKIQEAFVELYQQQEPFAEREYWDDLRFPATLIRQGATTKPDFDITNMGLLFPQNDATEIAYIIGQFPHARQNGSSIRPHIHFVQDEAELPVFKMDYRWYKNGSDPTGSFTTLTAETFAFTYTSGSILQIASFPEIVGTAIDAVSSVIDIKLYRDDNVVTGDVLVKEFDIHYQIDGNGSREEFIK